jgi:hypothetical protein
MVELAGQLAIFWQLSLVSMEQVAKVSATTTHADYAIS